MKNFVVTLSGKKILDSFGHDYRCCVSARSFKEAEAAARRELSWAAPMETVAVALDPNPAGCDFGERLVDVRMRNDDWNQLVCFLLMTSKYREGERNCWAELATERDTDGSPSYPNAAGNAKFWADMIGCVDRVVACVDGR